MKPAQETALDAFLGLVADKGFAAVALRDVAEAAGLGLADLYRLYPDKVALVAAFLARVEPLLVALDEAENDVREDGAFRGVLRMSMPTSFGIRDVIPRLASFAERHPNLHIQLQLGDRRQDLVKDAVDVAISVAKDNVLTSLNIFAFPIKIPFGILGGHLGKNEIHRPQI